jgi:tetratricopeptide (TPR) repeat protein
MLARLGRFKEAAAASDRTEQLSREHGDNEVHTWSQLARVEMDMCRADADAARDHARTALETGAKCDTPQSTFVGIFTQGVAHRLASDWDESVRLLEDAVRAVESGVNRMFEGTVRAELAKALLGRGELDRGEQEAQTAVTVARSQHSRCAEVQANLALTYIQLRRADAAALTRAEQALARAQELIDETGALIYQPEVHECRAHLARLRGDTPAARRELEAARRLYIDMGGTSQVERLKEEIGC